MRKRTIFILVLILVIFFLIGFTVKTGIRKDNILEDNKATINIIDDTDTIEVNASDEKTTPNTILIIKKIYTDCGHEISSRAVIPDEMVNLTKEDIVERYPNFKLDDFSKEQIVLSKEVDSFCGEHYLLIEENGEINIYSVDEEGEKSFKKKVDITLEYLPETDRITLKNGIMVYGTENLNRVIEDYEI